MSRRTTAPTCPGILEGNLQQVDARRAGRSQRDRSGRRIQTQIARQRVPAARRHDGQRLSLAIHPLQHLKDGPISARYRQSIVAARFPSQNGGVAWIFGKENVAGAAPEAFEDAAQAVLCRAAAGMRIDDRQPGAH